MYKSDYALLCLPCINIIQYRISIIIYKRHVVQIDNKVGTMEQQDR